MGKGVLLTLDFAGDLLARGQRTFEETKSGNREDTPCERLSSLLDAYAEIDMAGLVFRDFEMKELSDDCVTSLCEIQSYMGGLYGVKQTPDEERDNQLLHEIVNAVHNGEITKEEVLARMFPNRKKH